MDPDWFEHKQSHVLVESTQMEPDTPGDKELITC